MEHLYYVEGQHGCGLRVAVSITQARANFRKEFGTDGCISVKRANEADVGWVKGMGGHVPELEARP